MLIFFLILSNFWNLFILITSHNIATTNYFTKNHKLFMATIKPFKGIRPPKNLVENLDYLNLVVLDQIAFYKLQNSHKLFAYQ